MLRRFIYNFFIALEAITQNSLRALLTSLGIIFGVASVIAMMAIGRGAQQEILDQLKILGTNNVIVKPLVEQDEGEVAEDEDLQKTEKQRFTPGLTLMDAYSIEKIIPDVESISPEILYETLFIRQGKKRTSKLVGVTGNHFKDAGLHISSGNNFSDEQLLQGKPVCIIGNGIKTKFFTKENPIGKRIKCGIHWLTVVGVLKETNVTKSNIKHLGIRDYNLDVYTPITTMLLRYENRSMVTKNQLAAPRRGQENGREVQNVKQNYHQLDRLIVRVNDSQRSSMVAEIMSRMLERRHNNVVDFEIVVPEVLLKQEQRTRDILNNVLLAIASISLLVGGIGIMNIMLASVMERIREIGVRLSLGATPRDIIFQFLSESVAISISGGLVGVLLGALFSYIIETLTGINTIVSAWAIVVSFGVSMAVGLLFGIFPAKKAARQDPVVSLRYE